MAAKIGPGDHFWHFSRDRARSLQILQRRTNCFGILHQISHFSLQTHVSLCSLWHNSDQTYTASYSSVVAAEGWGEIYYRLLLLYFCHLTASATSLPCYLTTSLPHYPSYTSLPLLPHYPIPLYLCYLTTPATSLTCYPTILLPHYLTTPATSLPLLPHYL